MLISAIIIALLAGLAIKAGFYFLGASSYSGKAYSITWPEFALGAVIVSLIVAPLVVHFGWSIALNNSVGGFKEYWNGYETGTAWEKDSCSRDSGCAHTYNCDPYQVWHQTYDSKGNANGGYFTTEYHHCPYTTEEWTFIVHTSLGDYTIASRVLPEDPYRFEYRDGHGIPDSLVASAGIPDFWAEAKVRVDSNRPGPVTQVNKYDNYLLASQTTILKKYGAWIEDYRAQHLLPKPASGVTDFYKADKVYLVGRPQVADEAAWKQAVARFDAALGTSLQGDLHLLLVDANKIPNPDAWFSSLQGYWQSPELGKEAVAKNSIIVALGTKDGATVSWARAATGMPVGNEGMLTELRNELPGQPLAPSTLLGPPSAELVDGEPKVIVGDSLIEAIVLKGPNHFERVCMDCDDEGEAGTSSFSYLKDEIQPTGSQKFWIYFFATFFSLFVWAALIALDNRFSEGAVSAIRSIWSNNKSSKGPGSGPPNL